MKTWCGAAALLCVLLLAPDAASAMRPDQNAFSLGFVLGEPTGFTLRSGLGDGGAIQAHVGLDHLHGNNLAGMLDYTYDAFDFLRSSRSAALLFYLGLGGQAEWFGHHHDHWHHDHVYDGEHLGLGMRGLLGLRASFRAPFDLFLELAPVGLMFDVEDSSLYYDVDLAFGARFRF
jgi:hypothetical protein